ncbi:hypothetical protein [Sebaldella sp. S0638]|nr:hypothetical protein [Sebaldella sp. S0638]
MKKLFLVMTLVILLTSCASVHHSCNSSKKNPKCNTSIDLSAPDIDINIK